MSAILFEDYRIMRHDLYSRKRIWKWLLFASASVIFLAILYYSNVLIKNMGEEERHRVRIWADAVSYKAELVNYTEQFFDFIKSEEGKRAALLAQTMKKVSDASLKEDLTFYQDIIASNTTIPIILVSPDGEIDGWSMNVPDTVRNMHYISELGNVMDDYICMRMEYYHNRYVLIYYKESKIYTDLKVLINNLIQSFFQEIVINAASVPVIITDSSKQHVIISGNVPADELQPNMLGATLDDMKNQNSPIKVTLKEQGGPCYVFYKESSILSQLRYFPYLQFVILFIFIGAAYFLFSFARRSEQNQVWVGMSKETAHQLGTPISSLMAWNELLKESPVDKAVVKEIAKDVERLETIAQRFSKIGSVPTLKPENLITVIEEFVTYLQTRISLQTVIFIHKPAHDIVLPLNRYLFEWVMENLCKNAVDSMNGVGTITIDIIEAGQEVYVDISDTGKGISARKFGTIFQPGYSSKKRGWGLGLTLARRIIKEYHKGKLFVKNSQLDVGTTMRICLKKRGRL
ncbi:MAG: HAMP domain-containing histidine kinase [Bacteroidales bacterium]|nr:HAMP domain-containing histidine kinase [Bacteroidales bacterium]